MFLKLLLLIAIIGGIYFFFIKKKPQIPADTETMVECQKCGTFVSNKEAIIKNGKYYCSKECANAAES